MSDRFDLSEQPGYRQRLVFALFGIGQLSISSAAFQRDGFFYGLVVLLCGLTAFCTTAFFVHHLNRRLIWLGEEDIVHEEGLRNRQTLAWDEVEAVQLTNGTTTFHCKNGAVLTLHGTGEQWPDLASFLTALHTQTTARHIPVEGEL